MAGYDIAVVNLACAVGLPGAERMDAAGCLAILDRWAGLIRERTEEMIESAFRHNVGDYPHGEPEFRMMCLVRFLQRFCGVRYNPQRMSPPKDDPLEAEDEFIYGAIQGPGGTCASLPVLYTAVARRLGYPVSVVWSKGHDFFGHAFCRWDDSVRGERLNVEGTSKIGMHVYPDDHYREWPSACDAHAEEFFGYMRALTPREELLSFLESRSLVWVGAGQFRRAIDDLHTAAAADRHPHARYVSKIHRVIGQWGRRLLERGLLGETFSCPKIPSSHRRWPGLPWRFEVEIGQLELSERSGGGQ